MISGQALGIDLLLVAVAALAFPAPNVTTHHNLFIGSVQPLHIKCF